MSENIKDKVLALAKKQRSDDNIGTEFLDRTIYYGKERTDSEGRVIKHPNGEAIIDVLTYRTAGSWISRKMMEIALEIEKEFQELNDLYRADMERQGIPWRIPKSQISAMEIGGLIHPDENKKDPRKKKEDKKAIQTQVVIDVKHDDKEIKEAIKSLEDIGTRLGNILTGKKTDIH